MAENNNILDSHELRRMPFEVPSGYFEDLQERLATIPDRHPLEQVPSKVVKVPFRQIIAPYVALAACFLMAVIIGDFFLGGRSAVTEEESLVEYQQLYSEIMPVTNPYAVFDDTYVEDETVSDEDIVNYLISSGVSSDLIAYALYNY